MLRMKTESHGIFVQSQSDPVVEIDSDSGAAYIRFKKRGIKVAKTKTIPSRSMHVAVDLDIHDEVIGIEFVGADEFNIVKLLKMAHAHVPRMNLERVSYRPTPLYKEALV